MPIDNYFPSLDEAGWDNSGETVAVKMLSHFLSSDYSQSYQNYGDVSSLAWLLKEHGSDPVLMKNQTERTLSTYYGKYFSNVQVNVIIEPVSQNSIKQNMTLHINLTDSAGNSFTLRNVIETTNNIVTGMDAEQIESHL